MGLSTASLASAGGAANVKRSELESGVSCKSTSSFLEPGTVV